jgi:hypothetical protein
MNMIPLRHKSKVSKFMLKKHKSSYWDLWEEFEKLKVEAD